MPDESKASSINVGQWVDYFVKAILLTAMTGAYTWLWNANSTIQLQGQSLAECRKDQDYILEEIKSLDVIQSEVKSLEEDMEEAKTAVKEGMAEFRDLERKVEGHRHD